MSGSQQRTFKRKLQVKSERKNRSEIDDFVGENDVIVLSSRSPTPEPLPDRVSQEKFLVVMSCILLGVVAIGLLILAYSAVIDWIQTASRVVLDKCMVEQYTLFDNVREMVFDYRHRLAMFVEPANSVCICPCQKLSSL